MKLPPNVLLPEATCDAAAAARAATGQAARDAMTAPLERTVNPQDLDPQTVRLLPYPFAKAKGVLAARVVGRRARGVDPPVSRRPRRSPRCAAWPASRCKEVLLTPEEFEHCLALAYTREPSAAETIVEDMGESVDLAKLTEQLPEVADLLESRERRADHPPDQRAAHPGGARGRLRHAPRDLRVARAGALPRRRRAARRGRAARAACIRRWSRASRSWPRSTSPRSACRRTAASRCASPGAPIDVRVSTIPDRPRRARGAAPARQAGRAPHARRARHGARRRATRSTR